MRESGGKTKEAGTVERFPPNFFNKTKRMDPVLQCTRSLYTTPSKEKLQKKKNKTESYYKGQNEKKTKRGQKKVKK